MKLLIRAVLWRPRVAGHGSSWGLWTWIFSLLCVLRPSVWRFGDRMRGKSYHRSVRSRHPGELISKIGSSQENHAIFPSKTPSRRLCSVNQLKIRPLAFSYMRTSLGNSKTCLGCPSIEHENSRIGFRWLTQEKEWNADGSHGHGEIFKEVMRWHICHAKDGLNFALVTSRCWRGAEKGGRRYWPWQRSKEGRKCWPISWISIAQIFEWTRVIYQCQQLDVMSL